MADQEAIDKLKQLPPEERIAELKRVMAKLEEEKKKEIEEATNLIKDSEEEIHEKEELLKKIPIPQMKSVDINSLFSPEEKAMFKTLRYVDDGPKKQAVDFSGESTAQQSTQNRARTRRSESQSLEESVGDVRVRAARTEEAAREQFLRQQNEYIAQLSMRPAEELYNIATNIYQQSIEQGYLTQQQQEQSRAVIEAIYRKEGDIYNNRYKPESEALADKLSIAKRVLGYTRMT